MLRQSEEGFSVSVPGLPGCWSQGATEQEALENVRNAIQEYLSVVAEQVRGGGGPRGRGGCLAMGKLPGVNHLDAVRALGKAGFHIEDFKKLL